jgi:lipoprotein LprG
MKRFMLTRITAISILALFMSAMAACSLWEDDDTGSDSSDDLTAESVLDRAAERWNETNSLSFMLEAEGDSYLDSDRTIRLISAEGELVRPASVSATARVAVAIATVNVNIIVIEDSAYMTNLVTGNWERAPDDFTYNPALLFNPDDGLGPIMRDIRDTELHAAESVDGRTAHRITGLVSDDQIEDITAGSIDGDDIDVTIWIAEDNNDVLRLLLSADGEGDAGETTWDLYFSDHNQDVTIDAPI